MLICLSLHWHGFCSFLYEIGKVARKHMKIYLVQHGMNQTKEDDPQKGLSEQGVRDVEKMGQFISKMNLQFEAVFHSDKKRGIQTANILGKHLNNALGVHETDFLGPNDDVNVWLDRLLCSDADPILVGHLPFLNRLASKLVAQDEASQVLFFKHGGMVCLEDENGNENFSVRWAVTPEMIT